MESVATTTQVAAPPRTPSLLALWHLLSLDAPSVAALWTWFVARACGCRLPLVSVLAMAVAVWILYAADRLLDTRHLSTGRHRAVLELEARHLFHFRHRRAFLSGIALASVALVVLLPKLLQATLHLYLFEGALLIGWFLLVHATRLHLPKEFVVGAYFAVATFTPSVVRHPQHMGSLLLDALLFGAVCTVNCLLIHTWEHASGFASNLTPWIGVLIATSLATAIFETGPVSRIAMACGLAAILLLLLNKTHTRIKRIHLRAAADLALLTPLLLLPFLR